MEIGNLFSNPIIKNAALGTLKKAMKQGNYKTGLIVLNTETDELDFDFKENTFVPIDESDLEYYKRSVLELIELKEKYNIPL